MDRIAWGRVGCVVFCLVVWALLIWAVSPASGATSPGQDLADDTAEWIGQTMKAPPLYRELLRANEAPVLDGQEMAGVVWCKTPRATTLHPDVFDAWERSARRGWISEGDDPFLFVVIHELVHRGVESCVFDRFHEEGVTEAITIDLYPAWCRRFFGICARVESEAYQEEVTYIRHQSARAVGAGWKTRAARLWRRAFCLSERDARRAMLPPTRGGSL